MIIENFRPEEIMALTVWGEARGEKIEGQIAVANVIMNRWTTNPNKYKTVSDVCLEPKQFSCWNKNDINYSKILAIAESIHSRQITDKNFIQCLYIARGILNRYLLDTVKGNVNYMTTSLFNSTERPNWASHPKNELVIGNHTFFTA